MILFTVETLSTRIAHDLSSKKSIAEKCPCLVKGCEDVHVPENQTVSEHILNDPVCHQPHSMFSYNIITLPMYCTYMYMTLLELG